MATRMQQRRGTASQWTSANPTLAEGEIGWESDTNKFKIGDGVNNWASLSYFIDEDSLGGSLDGYATEAYVDTAVSNLVDSAPAALDTLNELAAALGDDSSFATTVTNAIAGKADLSGASFTGDISTTGISTAQSFIPTSSTIPTNGMYLGATNQLNFATNGVSRLSISPSLIFTSLPIGSQDAISGTDITAVSFFTGAARAGGSYGALGLTESASNIGYMGIPQSFAATTGAYTLTLADAGDHIYTTASRTVTIPANSSVAFPVGTTIVFISAADATTTIAITSDTLILAGSGTTGSRTLAAHGMATAVKVASTTWYISGNGLT